MTIPELTPEQKEHVSELVVVPRTEHGPLTWNNEDGNYDDTPAPDQAKSDRVIEQITEYCKRIRSQTRRGDVYFYKELHGYFFNLFDSSANTEEDRRAFLDSKFCLDFDIAYCTHRKHLWQMQLAAELKIKNVRRDLAAYLKIPQSDVLQDDERAELDNVYNWMIYQTQFDSMKWWQIPRAYKRRTMLMELIVRYFIETWQTATVLTSDQLLKWFSKDHHGWEVLLNKQIIFILLSEKVPLSFWDLLLERIQSLIGVSSVIFIHDQDAKTVLPKELATEYRRCAMPNVRPNSRLDKTTYKFQHESPMLKAE